MTSTIDADRFPEWAPFADAVRARRPETRTAKAIRCPLAASRKREPAYRALSDDDLWSACTDRMAEPGDVAAAADAIPDEHVGWTARTMKAAWFAEHMRATLETDAAARVLLVGPAARRSVPHLQQGRPRSPWPREESAQRLLTHAIHLTLINCLFLESPRSPWYVSIAR
jgi:hypothetical protein